MEESLFSKVAGLQPTTWSKKGLQCRCFALDFVNFLILFKFQKQSLAGVLQNKFSLKFWNTQRKTPVMESLISKVKGLHPATLFRKKLQHKCFTLNFAKFLRTPFYLTPPHDCFWIFILCSDKKYLLRNCIHFWIKVRFSKNLKKKVLVFNLFLYLNVKTSCWRWLTSYKTSV